MTAFRDVEDNLAALRILSDEAAQQNIAVESAQRSVDLALERYRGGVAIYTEVITTQNALLADQRVAIGVRTRRMDASVLLVKALGGGIAVQHRMAAEFNGDANRIRAWSVQSVKQALGLRTTEWNNAELKALDDLALVLALIPGLSEWNKPEKAQAVSVIRAKAGPDEAKYLKLMQKHQRLRTEMIRLG